MAVTDFALLEKWIHERDAEAFKEIASRHAGMVYATCRRILRNATEAEEVAQDCFEILARTREGPKQHVGAWLHKVATNRALNRIKAEKRRQQREQQFTAARGAHQDVEWNDIYGYVDEAIAELPDELRIPIVLHFFESQTHNAIARAIGTSRTTVTYRIKKGVEQIRKSLKRRGVVVPAAVLSSLLAKQLIAEAAPTTLTVALGKLALAGGCGAASSAAIGSKLAVLGGTALMWKNLSIAAGVIVLVVGLSYTLHRRAERRAASTRPPTQAEKMRPTGAVLEAPERRTPRQETLEQNAKRLADRDRGAQQPDDGQINALAVFEALFKAYRERTRAEQDRPTDRTLEPFSSEDIPPDNAAHYFLLAAELFPDVNRDWLFAKWEEIRTNGWSDDPQLQAFFEACQKSIDAIRKGLAAGNAIMPAPRGPSEEMPYLRTFRDLARAMAMQAQMQAAAGDYAAAFGSYATLLEFAQESSYGGSLINVAVGLAMDDLGLASLGDAINWGNATPENYQFLVDRLEALDVQPHPLWDTAIGEVEAIGAFLDTELAASADFRQVLLENMVDSDAHNLLASLSDAEFESALRDYLIDLREAADYFGLPYYEAQSLDLSDIVGDNPLSQAVFPSLMNLYARVTKDIAAMRGTMLMAGIELYRAENGSYPLSLDNLVPKYLADVPKDPFSGDSLAYRPAPSGYLLYSVGADMEDNGGAVDTWDSEGGDMILHGG